ncbi:hypothetical protein EV424DRAFT_1369610 [Suillus variegatus]|nr:hypothetical protein EV424DRAFT_1369610 [Suillus variegatus]
MGMALIWLWPVQGSPTCFQVVEGYSKFQLTETRKPPLRTRSVLLINLVERTSGCVLIIVPAPSPAISTSL